MNKTVLIIVGVILTLVLIVGGMSVSAYNGLVSDSEGVRQRESDIQADLQRRNDLIPNLVATVKGSAAHEETVLTEIAEARSRLMGASSTQETAEADAALSSAISRLLVVVESYPELQANQGFRDLQTQLEGTENRIKVARLRYNEQAGAYNTRLRRFPGSIIAGLAGFAPAPYFEASPEAQNAPEVSF